MPLLHIIFLLLRLLRGKEKRAQKVPPRPPPLPRVRVLDAETRAVTLIPERELPPGMVQMEVPGTGLVWVKAGTLKQSGLIHPPFPPGALEVVKEIKAALDEVFPQSLEKWEEDLRRVARPEAEVARWLRVADAYKICTQGKWLAVDAKRDYYNVLHACSVSPRGRALKSVRLVAISRSEALRVAEVYDNNQ